LKIDILYVFGLENENLKPDKNNELMIWGNKMVVGGRQ
jgi:hypothetical protein